MERIALFDIDKTITRQDTFALFLRFLWKSKVISAWHMAICGIAALLYLCGIISAKKAKEISLKPLTGYTEKQLDSLANRFWKEESDGLFYEDAWKEIAKLHKEGCRIVLITASPFFYMQKLYRHKEISRIIGTELAMEHGVYTGKIRGENCKGEVKVKRFAAYCLEQGISANYEESSAYSDSLSDLPMLGLVANRFLINSKKQREGIENLTWN